MFKQMRRISICAIATLSAVVTYSCTPGNFSNKSELTSNKYDSANAPDTFRDIFYNYAKEKYSKEEIQQLIYSFPPEMKKLLIDDKLEGNPIEATRNVLIKFRQSQLYAESVKQPFTEYSPEELNAPLTEKGPVTIVLIPGIFGEFINNMPYHELLTNTNNFLANKFANAMAAPGMEEVKSDLVYSLENEGNINLPLTDSVKAISLDDKHGIPQLNFVYLRPRLGSFETMGDTKDNAQVYLKRLDKYFKLMGTPNKFYLMGYSRGAIVGIDMVIDGKKEGTKYPWLQNVKGIISLGGVLFGSAVADNTFPQIPSEKPSANEHLFTELVSLADGLQDYSSNDSLITTAWKLKNNTSWWIYSLAKIGYYQANSWYYSQMPEGLKMENLPTEGTNISAMYNLFCNVAFKMFDLSKPVNDYFGNIRRFKILVNKAVTASRGLTTYGREAWFKSNPLPSDLKYFSISDSMADITTRDRGISPLLFNNLTTFTESYDFSVLRRGFYDIFRITGEELNDSQVTLHKSAFWPAMVKMYSPDFDAKNHHFIGILGTHHWGMALPIAFESSSNRLDPFPREIVLRSLANYIARTEQ